MLSTKQKSKERNKDQYKNSAANKFNISQDRRIVSYNLRSRDNSIHNIKSVELMLLESGGSLAKEILEYTEIVRNSHLSKIDNQRSEAIGRPKYIAL